MPPDAFTSPTPSIIVPRRYKPLRATSFCMEDFTA